MKYDFDSVIDRSGTSSIKWEYKEYGEKGIIPMWVADMDFKSPQPVIDVLQETAKHGIYGYPQPSPGYYESVVGWLKKIHGWEIQMEWITFSPGVVPALNWLVRAYTKPGDKVMLQSPTYPPFFKAIEFAGCEVVNNPLVYEAGQYSMDFGDMEEKFSSGVKLFLLCSPHNPVGRVWTREELTRLGELALRYGVTVIADEIHSDLIYSPNRHIPLPLISEELAQSTVVCTSPAKTFNLAGLQVSSIIIPNPQLRKKFSEILDHNGVHRPNIFAISAFEAAYKYGEEWYRQLLDYLEGNLAYLLEFAADKMPRVKAVKPQGTYLVWLDFRELGLGRKELSKLLREKAKVGLMDGYGFGPGGEGFARINIGCPRVILQEGLDRIARAVEAI